MMPLSDKSLAIRLLLGGLALGLPMVVFLSFLLQSSNQSIDFTVSEIKGIEYLVAVKPLARWIAEHRGLVNGYRAGEATLEKRILEDQQHIDQQMDLLIERYAEAGASVFDVSKLLKLRANWNQLKSEWDTDSQLAVFRRHTDLIRDLIGLTREIGNRSNLVLDNHLDSHFLMDLVVNRLLPLAENIGQLRGYSTGLAANNWTVSVSDIQRIAVYEYAILNAQKELRYDTEIISSENPEIGEALGLQLAKIDQSLARFQSVAVPIHEGPVDASHDPLAIFNTGSEAIDLTFQMFTVSASYLQQILQAREADLRKTQAIYIAVVCLATLIAFGFGLALVRLTAKASQQRADELEREIKERRMETRARELSEAKLLGILNTAADGIVTIDGNGIIQSFNRAAETIFRISTDTAVGQNISTLMPDDLSQVHDNYLSNYLATGKAKTIGKQRELIGLRADGEQFPIELSISETVSEDGVLFTGIVRDISERKAAQNSLHQTIAELRQTQQSLVEAEKMASLGSLVAGVAHEINTPIGVGVTAASHLGETASSMKNLLANNQLKRSDLDALIETVDQSTTMITANLDRASNLIKSFKQVAVDQTHDEVRPIKLSTHLEEILMSLHPQLKHTKHQVAISCEPDLLIESFPGAFAQIVTNLIMNSLKHAFGDEDEGRIRIDVEKRDQVVELVYSDNGCGMDAVTEKRVFEPFFTTQRGNGGTGLGMHILYNLVTQKLEGRITCVSRPNEGMTVNIMFPAKSTKMLTTPSPADGPSAIPA